MPSALYLWIDYISRNLYYNNYDYNKQHKQSVFQKKKETKTEPEKLNWKIKNLKDSEIEVLIGVWLEWIDADGHKRPDKENTRKVFLDYWGSHTKEDFMIKKSEYFKKEKKTLETGVSSTKP